MYIQEVELLLPFFFFNGFNFTGKTSRQMTLENLIMNYLFLYLFSNIFWHVRRLYSGQYGEREREKTRKNVQNAKIYGNTQWTEDENSVFF